MGNDNKMVICEMFSNRKHDFIGIILPVSYRTAEMDDFWYGLEFRKVKAISVPMWEQLKSYPVQIPET